MFKIKSLVILVLLASPVTNLSSQEKEGERLVWKAFDPAVNKEFFQEMTTITKQTMKVMGMEVVQHQEQTFLMRWVPHGKDTKQNWRVTQEIVGVKMKIDIGGSRIEHDSDKVGPANPLADFMNALLKAKIEFLFNRRLQVQDIRGHEDLAKGLVGVNPGMQQLLKTILSREALIQMVEPPFAALPMEPVKKGSTWKHHSELNLGPIGTYKNATTYTYEGKEGELDRIGIFSALTYVAPKMAAPGLPFKIVKAEFRQATQRGFALFDREKGRFVRMETKGGLEGDMRIEVGGMETAISIIQLQETRVRTMDKRP